MNSHHSLENSPSIFHEQDHLLVFSSEQKQALSCGSLFSPKRFPTARSSRGYSGPACKGSGDRGKPLESGCKALLDPICSLTFFWTLVAKLNDLFSSHGLLPISGQAFTDSPADFDSRSGLQSKKSWDQLPRMAAIKRPGCHLTSYILPVLKLFRNKSSPAAKLAVIQAGWISRIDSHQHDISQPGQGFERLYLTPLLDVTARESNSSAQCKVRPGYLL